MKKVTYIRQFLAFLLIISILIISGCKGKKSADSNTATTKTPGTSRRRPLDDLFILPDANEVAATVNGVEIKEGKIQEIIKPEIERIRESYLNAPESIQVEPMITQDIKTAREVTLLQLIREQLLEEKVKDVNIAITTEEADKSFRERLETESVNMEQFKQVLTENNISYDEVLEEVKKEMTYIKFIDSQMDDSVKVTEEDANKYYEENPKAFTKPEQVRASHILVSFKPDESKEVKEKAKEKIDDLLHQVKEGADFAELAKANSDDIYSAPDGGDIGYFPRGEYDPNFEKVSFDLPVDEVSDVVETYQGYHIVKVTDHQKEEIIPFDEIKEKLIEALSYRKKEEFTRKYIESLIKEADIKFPEGKEIKF